MIDGKVWFVATCGQQKQENEILEKPRLTNQRLPSGLVIKVFVFIFIFIFFWVHRDDHHAVEISFIIRHREPMNAW